MSVKTTFEVTKKAGAFVAGMRNPGAGKSLDLTEEQARYPLITGEICRPEAKTGNDDVVMSVEPAAGAKPKKG